MTAEEFREFIKSNSNVIQAKGRSVGRSMLFIDQSTDKKPKIQNNHGSVKVWHEVGEKKYFFRSTYEINYALILQFKKKNRLILDWFYEEKEFWFTGIKRGVCSYKTDFKVINVDGSHEWHEVKGYMDKKSATKLKRMAKYYPNEKVILIDKTTLSNLKKQIPCNYVKKSDFVKILNNDQ